jgi:hypothetical protein
VAQHDLGHSERTPFTGAPIGLLTLLKGWTRLDAPANYTRMKGLGKHPCDPHDLIHEAYRIDGIGPEECRAIFFDWAMGLPPEIDIVAAAKSLQSDLAAGDPNHPMSGLLAEASVRTTRPRGRSGRRRRPAS